ncbi:MAG TPA: T9SS type A sorting domain-containing protein [Hanamia sp.]|nr:T9SS type A sorting domain-containing protein [Hanamia sp.]
MKKIVYIQFLLLLINQAVFSQTITSSIQANFGVDADLRANYFNSKSTLSGDDDWFAKFLDTGIGVIDTTGASAIVAQYASNSAYRYTSFYKRMSVPPFTTVNNKLLLGAAFIRDYHGNDSTSFSGSKNGQSPGVWYSPPTQPIPNKNDILDVMMHLRRDGPSMSDSLWLFGGISIYGTTGDRYFDFEMYQTDLSYDKASGTFSGYGPDAGHTSWTFDGSGNVVTPGDIIFSADYGSSTLTSIEARIWINRASLSITPASFDWVDASGTTGFDGVSNGSTYGYAAIKPKSSGNFYTGVENSSSTWAGAFSLIQGDNTLVTNYNAGQFMEFSVNLTKLGLDPNTMVGKSSCDMPFRRFMVKSRSSTSFTSQLKDFVAPIDFFQSVAGQTASDASLFCGYTGPVNLYVNEPSSTSIYTWSTTDGDIVTDPVNDTVTVDKAGTYVVSQQLQSFCPAYATDTVVIALFDATCNVLNSTVTQFSGYVNKSNAQLNWSVSNNGEIKYFEIEKSVDGINFSPLQEIKAESSNFSTVNYNYTDYNAFTETPSLFYRLKIINASGKVTLSSIIHLSTNNDQVKTIKIFPNPVSEKFQVNVNVLEKEAIELSIYDGTGRLMRRINKDIEKGSSVITVSGFDFWPTGIYTIKLIAGKEYFVNKIILKK